jgi:putative ABC transport system permease protein
MNWLKQLFSRRSLYNDLSDEMQQHLEEKIEELVATGMPRKEATAAARRAFGNLTLVEEDSRAVWRWRFVEQFFSDVRFGLRGLRRNSSFAAVAILTFALGVGSITAIYSVTYATLLAPLPYPEPKQLVMVWPTRANKRVWGASTGDFLDWKRESNVFQDLNAATASGTSFNLATSTRPEHVIAQQATPGYYGMIGARFFLGRSFLPEEGTPGKDHVVILTYKLWKRLGADSGIIGKPLRMDGVPYTVVGVASPGPLDRIQFEMIVPLVFRPDQINHGNHWLFVMGRLKPGVTITEAQADMSVVALRIAQDNPQTNTNWWVSVEPLQDDFLPPAVKSILWLLFGAVGLVLCIACLNVANLLLARSTVRQKEIAVRVSLGASRQRIFAQFLTESLVLAIVGGAVGAGLAGVLTKIIVSMLPEFALPSEADVKISTAVLLFTLVISLSAGVVFGCAPAWQACGVDPNRALKGGRTGAGPGRQRLRQALIVLEFGFALTLLAGAGLAIRSFWNLARVDLGVRTDHILTFSLPVADGRLVQPQQMVTFYRELLTRIEAAPGVSAVAASTGLPVAGTHGGIQFWIAGAPAVDRDSRPGAAFQAVTPGYYQAFGIKIVKGREFTREDSAGGLQVAVVNENFVRHYLPGVDPLTQRIIVETKRIPGVPAERPLEEWQIVGVFRNVRSFGARNAEVPEIDVPFWQSPSPQAEIAVRTVGDPSAMIANVSDVVAFMEPDLPLANVKTMDQIVDESLAGDRFFTVLYAGFAALALLLAAVGIYGVMAFAVAQRTHEIGLRLALGARRDQVLRMVLTGGTRLALLGLAFGLLGAIAVGRILKGMLYGVAGLDFGVFVLVALTLLATAVLASYLPAWRASRVDPIIALRYE